MPQLKNWATTSDNICKQTRHIYVMYSIYIHVHNSCGIRPNFVVCTQTINILSTYYHPKIFKKVKYEVSEVKSQDTNMNTVAAHLRATAINLKSAFFTREFTK